MSILSPNIGRTWRQARWNPLRNLTPEKLTRALELFDAGYVRDAALAWEMIEEHDDILKNAAPKRRKAVSRQPWQILVTDESAEAQAHKAALEFFFNHCTATDAADENQRGGFAMLLRQMMDATFKRYAAHEIVWKPSADGFLTAEFRFVPLYFFENTTGRLRYIGPEGARSDGMPLPEGEWMITCGDGVMRAASLCFMFKRLSLQDWLSYGEKFGIPGVHGETAAAPGSTEWNNFVDALDAFANDWVCATTTGTKINLIETRGSADAPFAPMVERMDRRIAALCRGADLSTLSREDGAGASLQGDETDLLMVDDCASLSETLQTQVCRRVTQTLFGAEPLAYLAIAPPQDQDTQREIMVDEFLLRHGVRLPKAETVERYGRAEAEEGEDALESGASQGEPEGGEPGARGGEEPDKEDAEPEADAEKDAENDAQAVAASLLGAPADWLDGARDLFERITARTANKTLTTEELVQLLEEAADRLPELLDRNTIEALAKPMERALGAAVIEGVREGVRTKNEATKRT